jgi:hypothetical protein
MTNIGNWPGRKKKNNAEDTESLEFAEKSRGRKSGSLVAAGKPHPRTARVRDDSV